MKDRQYVCSELKEEGTSMAFRDLGAWLKGLLNGGQGNSSRRPDGGTSCYRPIQRRNRQEEEQAREKAAEYAAGQPRVASLHTGFTGMNPPPSGPMPVQNTQSGYPGFAGDNGNSGNPGYYGQAGFSGNPGFAGNDSRNFGGNGSANVPGGNISYMPGVYGQDAGSTCTHVEHIMTITSLRSCYDANECMKNEETLIVTLDVLGSDSERIRCQDMLAGAAFTLGCSVRNLQSVGVVIIAPAGVKILPERQVRTMPEPQGIPQQAPVQEGYIPPRERRSSQNAIGWENATSGMSTGYNPYTGSMPAAAGAYSAYGGY